MNSPRTSCVERGLQVLEELEEHATPMKRCEGEEKREEWAEHRQCDLEVQGLEDMLWRSEGLKSLEEGLPWLKEENLAKASRSYKVTRGLGGDQFNSKVLVNLARETREKCEVPRANQALWVMAATSLHDDFLDPEQRHERTLHRAGADSDLMV